MNPSNNATNVQIKITFVIFSKKVMDKFMDKNFWTNCIVN